MVYEAGVMSTIARLRTGLSTLGIAAALLLATPPREALAACLSAGEARAVIASGRVLPPGQITSALRRRYQVDIIDVQLCAEGRGYIYQLTVLGSAGRVRRIAVNASSGQLLGGGL